MVEERPLVRHALPENGLEWHLFESSLVVTSNSTQLIALYTSTYHRQGEKLGVIWISGP